MDIMELVNAAAEDLGPQIAPPATPVPGLILHVDGDYLAYYASGNEECTEGQARMNALDLLASAKASSGATRIVVHNTASGATKGERYVIATVRLYQGQRDPGRKPKNYYYMRDWLLGYSGDIFTSKTWVAREADDGISACCVHAVSTPVGYAAIFTRDKDMQMLPGLHVEWLSRETLMVPPGTYEIRHAWRDGKEKVYGLKWFWLQMLMGDTADNIPGLEGYATTNAKGVEVFKPMGEKTAEQFLEGTKNSAEAFVIVRKLYKDYYDAKNINWADRFVEQAALLWLRTDNRASVSNFSSNQGCSNISASFCTEVLEAVNRLERRVIDARTEINELSN
jgi:DNA polymerase-1